MMRIGIAQLQVGLNIHENTAKVIEILDTVQTNDWIAFPEGALTGYAPQKKDYLSDLNPKIVSDCIERVAARVRAKAGTCLVGTALHQKSKWFNAGIIIGPNGEKAVYRKRALSAIDRSCFTPGHHALFRTLNDVPFGILICREIVVPSLWTTLKSRGVRVVFHLNNALKREDHIWRHLLIARAVGNGIFVCSINARGPAYGLGSFVISPRGDVLLHIPSDEERVSWTEMNLSQVVDDFS
jgi:predicted amidohydrolase